MAQIRHGHAFNGISPTYSSWAGMKRRCLDPKATSYPRYGAVGITVCERWLKFDNFLADMGARPDGKTLDRIKNNRGYEPSNCRWATNEEQRQNRKKKYVVKPTVSDGILLLVQFLRPTIADIRIAERLNIWRGAIVRELGPREFRVRAA